MQRETSSQIDQAAADWAARVDRGELSQAEQGELDRWMNADPRRLGAFMRMRAVSIHSERAQALGETFDPARFADNDPEPGPRISRRELVWGGGALAASIAALLTLSPLLSQGEIYQTRTGESRVVTLADGSVVTLNTQTRLEVKFNDDERLIELSDGEAIFEVAHNKVRPFIVIAAGSRVRAVGTKFVVRKLGERPVAVTVTEGVVELTKPAMARPVRIGANNRVVVAERSTEARPVQITKDEVARETAWKAGRIAFEGESLGQASAEFARYSDIDIIIEDPAVAREEITGLFAANDPVSFARAAAISLDLQVKVGDGEVRLARK